MSRFSVHGSHGEFWSSDYLVGLSWLPSTASFSITLSLTCDIVSALKLLPVSVLYSAKIMCSGVVLVVLITQIKLLHKMNLEYFLKVIEPLTCYTVELVYKEVLDSNLIKVTKGVIESTKYKDI
jgi:hypothetical protein